MKRKWIFYAPLVMVVVVLFVAIGGWAVQFLWNWLLPDLFGLRQITFWQALGLLALCRILFGGFGGRGGSGSYYSRRWQHMTPEERERVRHRMRERLGLERPDATDFGPSARRAEGQ
jgi:hypothetical protein